MSGTRETSLWNWLKRSRLELEADLHINRVENAVGSGMPDVEGFLYNHGQFWIELKCSERPTRSTSKLTLATRGRDDQKRWLTKRWGLGGAAWMLIQVGSGHKATKYLVPGLWADKVYSGVTEHDLQEYDVLAQNFQVLTPMSVVTAAAQWGPLSNMWRD